MSQRPHLAITRTAEPLRLEAIQAGRLDEITGVAGKLAPGAVLVAADLSLGAWRGHQVACELCAQLGLPLPPRKAVIPPGSAGADRADALGQLTDEEGAGESAVRIAFQLARAVLEAQQGQRRIFVLLTPRSGLPWEREDLLFLRFFVPGIRGTDSRLLLVHAEPGEPRWPAGWEVHWIARFPVSARGEGGVLGLVPAVVPPQVCDRLRPLDVLCRTLPLLGGHQLIAPECRRRPEDVAPDLHERLAGAVPECGWLRAYAEAQGGRTAPDIQLLCREANERFAEGGPDIGLRLLLRAIDRLPASLARGVAEAQALGIRVLLGQLEEVAGAPVPAYDLPAPLVGVFLLLKAYGLVMLGVDLLDAEICFREGLDLVKPASSEREYLYWMNLYALNRHKLGDAEGALAIEHLIESRLADPARRDWRLQYINFLNIARLHRHRGALALAETYLQRAFAINSGSRSESDGVYFNVCLARLHAARGQGEESFHAWLRAGLHWVACELPEALAPRAASAILGRRVRPLADVAEEVSAALLAGIDRAAQGVLAAALPDAEDAEDAEDAGRPVPAFAYSGPFGAMEGRGVLAVGGPGWSLLLSDLARPAQWSGRQHRRLRQFLRRLLAVLSGRPEILAAATLVVDHRLGREIPATPVELVEACLRLGVERIAVGERTVELGARLRRRLEDGLRVRLGCAVDRLDLDRASVSFRRYLAPIQLSAQEARLLSRLQAAPRLDELARACPEIGSPLAVGLLARDLERRRVVDLVLAEETLAREGIVRYGRG